MTIDPQDFEALLALAEERGISVRVGETELKVKLSDCAKAVAPQARTTELARMVMLRLVEAARATAFKEGKLELHQD